LYDFKGTNLELHLLILEVVKAIEFIHSKGVILCDFKFENVLVSKSKNGLSVRITDLYGAFIEGTVPPKYVYTYDYAPPETLRNKSEITRAADVFAFTVSLAKKVEDMEEPATSLKIIYNDTHTFNCVYPAALEVIRHRTNFKSIYINIFRAALDPNPVTRPTIQWIRQELERFPVPAAAPSRSKEVNSELG
jgi:serine/threonine protein kinase